MLKKIKYSILNNRRIYEAALIIISSLLGVITFLVSYNNTLSGFLFVGLTVLYVFLATFNIFACHKAIIYRQELGNYYIGNIPIPKISLLPSYIGSVDYIRNKLHIQNVSIDWEVINDDIAYNTKFSLTKNSKTTTFNYTLLEKASRVKKSQPPILKCSSSSDECPCQGPPKIHYERIHTYSYKLPEPPKKFDELNISYRMGQNILLCN